MSVARSDMASSSIGHAPAQTRYHITLRYREIGKSETRRNVLSTYDYELGAETARDYGGHIAAHLCRPLTVEWTMYDDHGTSVGNGVVQVEPYSF